MKWLCFLLGPILWAQVNFEVTPQELPVNGRLQLRIVVDNPQSGRNISLPNGLAEGDFQLLNRYPSSSSMTQIINGKVTQTQTYTYEFQPTKQGTLTFPAQTIEYLGKTYSSDPVKITVGPPESQVQTRRRNNMSDPFDDFFGRNRSVREEPEVFAVAEIGKKSFYMGEAIPFQLKLYSRAVFIDGGRSRVDLPPFEGFWSEDEPMTQSVNTTEAQNGKIYNVNIVDRRVLFANKPGKISIPAASFDLYVKPSGIFEDYQRVLRKTEAIELDIKPLPKQYQPANFGGLVGQFDLRADEPPSSVRAGETVSLKIDLLGSGNFNAISDLRPSGLDASIEVFDGGAPQVERKNGQINLKSWTYALVPKKEGDYQIPAVELNYFDPEKGAYQHLQAGPWSLNVMPGTAGLPVNSAGVVGQRINLEQHLRFINLKENLKSRTLPTPSPRFLWWLACGLLGLNVVLLVFQSIWDKVRAQGSIKAPERALKRFIKNLHLLNKQSPKLAADPFFSQLSQLLYQYLGERLNRPAQGISLDIVDEALRKRGTAEQVYADLVEVIENCDLARFTPGSPASREKILEKARSVIENLDGVLSS